MFFVLAVLVRLCTLCSDKGEGERGVCLLKEDQGKTLVFADVHEGIERALISRELKKNLEALKLQAFRMTRQIQRNRRR